VENKILIINIMKLRTFYKTNHKGEPVPASNIRRLSKPPGSWREFKNVCCFSEEVSCTCDFRYFVQIDNQGNPVDHTLIKRKKFPENQRLGIRYAEVNWKNICCGDLTWDLDVLNTDGSLIIKVNGVEVVNQIAEANTSYTGGVLANVGDTIEITLTNNSLTDVLTVIEITGGHEYDNNGIDDGQSVATYTYVWNGQNTHIHTFLDAIIR